VCRYSRAMRLAAYTDDPYLRAGGSVAAVMPFALFLAALGDHVDRLVLLGRVGDDVDAARPVALPASVEFVALPWWVDLSRPLGLARVVPESVRRFWRVLDDVDAVLLFGPSPLGMAFAALARVRGRPVILGVRMDYVAYVRHRHPGREALSTIARALDAGWRALARRRPTIVVGAGLARRYRRAARLLDVTVSLVRDDQVARGEEAAPAVGGPVTVLSVGRLDAEKNPLLLADVLADLRAGGEDWRLVVCGEGPLKPALAARLDELGLAAHADLRGFVGPDDGLMDLYRDADMFLHVSWTEGVPQVLVEAWATGLPIVATDVGGVRAATDDGALLVGPGDAAAAAGALRRLRADDDARTRLVARGLELARARTLEHETARVARFLSTAGAEV
jgi:glycosyltransferase involved in cell wall biosynthesis